MDYNKIYDLNYPLSNDINSSSNFQLSKDINSPYNALISNNINTSNNLIFLNSIIYDDESGCCCCKCCNSQIILNDPNNITFIQNGLCFVFFLFLFSSIFPLFLLSLAILNIFEEDKTIAIVVGLFLLLFPILLGTVVECRVYIKLDNDSIKVIKRRLLFRKTRVYYKAEVSYIKIKCTSGEESGYKYNIDLITTSRNEDIFFFSSNKEIIELNGIIYIINYINKYIETNMRL